MELSNPGWEVQFHLMRKRFHEHLPGRISALEHAWEELQRSGWSDTTFATFKGLLHQLSGTGASFGFHALSTTARQLEQYLEREITVTGSAPGMVHLARLGKYLHAIREQSQNPRDVEGPPLSLLNPRAPESDTDPAINKFLIVISPEGPVGLELAAQLMHFGYSLQCLSSLQALEALHPPPTPAAILLHTDMICQEGGTEQLMALRKQLHSTCPLLFFSMQVDLETRLLAVRAGGCAFFPIPVEIAGLVNKLDSLTEQQRPDPFRILIVEDDPIMASYLSAILHHAGMLTEVVTNPIHILQPLTELRPDLVLMDMYLQPDCDGLELAEVIRQVDLFVNIPIIFISTEVDVERRLEVMRQGGGDDFLTKPILPQHLIQAVVTRAERSRHLSTFMLRDSLTGLLNHTRFKEHLHIEMSRTARQSAEMALAILDIDHFKLVNDTHGHPSGDRVLRSLARMLTQRLRKTDIIGRLGGEEFGVILPGTRAESALKVLEGLRRDFRAITHHSTQGEFHVSFSAGVVSTCLTLDPVLLSDLADKALYTAKHRGRDQIVLVPEQEPPSIRS